MARQTRDQFLNGMAKKSQRLDWDVVLAFDRSKTNYLLLQSYISRFGKLSLFPPVNCTIVLSSGNTHQLIGLRLDAPRLSFGNAVITGHRPVGKFAQRGVELHDGPSSLGTHLENLATALSDASAIQQC